MRLENPDRHTLAFRYIQRPGEGLQLGLLGKVHARTEKEAADHGVDFYRGIRSTFPYDYSLTPACDRLDFSQISGQGILIDNRSSSWLAQIRRVEIPAVPDQKPPFLQGLWQTSAHAHEAIWRSLALAPTPVMLNVQLRSTILYEREKNLLLMSNRQVAEIDEGTISQKALTAIQEWSTRYTERRLMPWKKFFYLQIHLTASGDVDENLCRTVGTSLTLPAERESLPGYQLSIPRREEEPIWRKQLMDLSLISSISRLSVPRLADVADIDEVFAALRLPYSPPDNGFPDFNFASAVNR